eukprot:7390194-Prymnesium_polylepis.2
MPVSTNDAPSTQRLVAYAAARIPQPTAPSDGANHSLVRTAAPRTRPHSRRRRRRPRPAAATMPDPRVRSPDAAHRHQELRAAGCRAAAAP